MIRMLFAILLTLAALVGLALRMARDMEPVQTALREVRTLELPGLARSEAPSPETPEERPAPAGAAPAGAPPPPAAPSDAAATPDAPEEIALTGRSEPFRESPPPLEPAAGALDAPDPERETVLAGPVDQDAWAELIRRMLAVYRRTSGLE